MNEQPLKSFSPRHNQNSDGSAKLRTGRAGENLAKMYLENQGYLVLAQNWRNSRYGEIDLIVLNTTQIIAVEVKTRRGLGFGDPLDSITRKKLSRIRYAFIHWLSHNRRYYPERDIRIDGLGILLLPRQFPRFDHRIGLM